MLILRFKLETDCYDDIDLAFSSTCAFVFLSELTEMGRGLFLQHIMKLLEIQP